MGTALLSWNRLSSLFGLHAQGCPRHRMGTALLSWNRLSSLFGLHRQEYEQVRARGTGNARGK